MICGWKEVEGSEDNGECCMIEKFSNGHMHVFAFDFDSDAIVLGYPRYAEHAERLLQHQWKV